MFFFSSDLLIDEQLFILNLWGHFCASCHILYGDGFKRSVRQRELEPIKQPCQKEIKFPFRIGPDMYMYQEMTENDVKPIFLH